MNSKEENDIILEPFDNQVGGHRPIFYHPDNRDLLIKLAAPREIKFYQDVYSSSRHHPDILDPLRSVMSGYHGVMHLNGKEWLVLENLTAGMKHPCIMDVKIGRRMYDIDADPEKIARTRRKAAQTTTESLGFRLSGMKMYSSGSSDDRLALVETKEQLRNLSCSSQVAQRIDTFISGHAKALKDRIELISRIVATSPVLLYSSSLLIIYDDESAKLDCRMIDFTHSHVKPPDNLLPDRNYLEGFLCFIKEQH